jgi:NAD(P)-dependent dehydrogenase (short-subunit alcohol dehydrogenase family)
MSLENKGALVTSGVTGHRPCYRAAARPRRRARCHQLREQRPGRHGDSGDDRTHRRQGVCYPSFLGSQDEADKLFRDLDAQGLHRFDVLVNNAAVGLPNG